MGYVVGYDGVKFPATQVASSDANTLDDYEEGTWTPADASGATLTFTGAAGTYEKIGRQVTARCVLTYPVTANGSSAVWSGLPFALANAAETRQGIVTYTDETTLRYILPTANSTTSIALCDSGGSPITNATMSGNTVHATFIYHI